MPTIPIVIGGEARSADLPTACLHSFEKAAHLQRLILGLRGVDPLAEAGDSQIILHPDEPLDLGNLCYEEDQSAAERMAQSFRAPTNFEEPGADPPPRGEDRDRRLGVASGPLCGSGLLTAPL